MPDIRKLSFLSFFLSGFSALSYQVLWKRYLSLALGSTVYAISSVIAVFMVGLGIGSVLFGRFCDRRRRPFLIYFFLQVSIGVTTILLPVFYPIILKTVSSLHSWIFMLLIISPFLLLPSILMGGTFPVLSRALEPVSKERGVVPGGLYFINTAGGVSGALITGFFLIKYLGMNLTYAMTVLVSFISGMIIIPFIRNEIGVRDYGGIEKIGGLLIPFAAFLTGFSGIGLEVLWNRVLGIYLPNTTYTFSTILVLYLIGLSTGSYIYYKRLKKFNPLSVAGLTLTFISVFILISLLLLPHLPDIVLKVPFVKSPELRYILPAIIMSIFLFLPATVLMGITFPLFLKVYTSEKRPGESTGMLYLFNTIGSTIGPLFAGFFLIKSIGTYRSIVLLGVIYLIIGSLFFLRDRKKLIFPIIVFLLMGALYIRRPPMILPPSIKRAKNRKDRVLFYREFPSGTVVVVEDMNTGIRACYVDNSVVVGTAYDALKAVKLLGNLPLLFNQKPEDVLVIGFGTGITTSSIALHRSVKSIDCVEIARGLDTASVLFLRYNRGVISDRRVNYIVNDGRNYLLQTDKIYDVITCDPTHPALGSGSLYTMEFYSLVRSRLKRGGIFAEYFPLHKLGKREFLTMLRTFRRAFPYTLIWIGGAHGVMMGSETPLLINPDSLKIRMGEEDVMDDLASIYSETIYKLGKSFFLDQDGIQKMTGDGMVNSDNHPVLEFFGFESGRLENWEINMNLLLENREDYSRIFTGEIDRDSVNLYRFASDSYYRGLIEKNRGNFKGYREWLLKALTILPHESEYHLLLSGDGG